MNILTRSCNSVESTRNSRSTLYSLNIYANKYAFLVHIIFMRAMLQTQHHNFWRQYRLHISSHPHTLSLCHTHMNAAILSPRWNFFSLSSISRVKLFITNAYVCDIDVNYIRKKFLVIVIHNMFHTFWSWSRVY